ncbi:6-hydroxymethylpterin diphosphokinase MptE-like protein [Arcobacter cloacae]|uniref:Uncharacterized protein n=1 Tax=Arcobacter cloacae TaxID=1054034 RepID=A0A6M8NP38_9BACT|nr:6-hydroxymethylpterin diphosphokinase MptE-like protein [Arcobacter cloacae]QKF90940.1 motility accessory factor [Arcobacter cloacae]RXI43061.1 hypothetical protein CP963_00375 [Arcobacter cloacae]
MDKTSAYEEIEKTLQEIFINNLEFFKINFPLIYKKIVEFEKLNLENYSINFINNKFQLNNTPTNQNFYEIEPFQDSMNRINKFDISSAFNLVKIEQLKNKNPYKNEINAYSYLNEFIEHFQNIDIKINKFIFLGTLLGVHINDFDKFLKAKTYFIFEPNIEIFRLSMFMTDYKILSKNAKLFFAINEDEQGLNNICKEFLNYNYEFNNLIHFELADKINEPLINELSLIFTHLGEMRHPFSEYLISLKRFHNYFVNNNYNLINISKIHNFLEDKRILFLAAGPSLERNLDFVHKNKNKFIIVTVAATLKILETKKITPDIIITVDGHHIISKQFEVDKSIYENSIILSSIKLDIEIHKLFKNENLFFFQNSLNLFEEFGFITGVTVGDIGIDLLLRLGANNLYLLGVDAAIDSKTGITHINTHSHSKKIDLDYNKTIDFNKTILYVKGNFEEKVPTLMEYKEMIEEINEKFSFINDNLKIFNLSNGAYFNNTISLRASKLKIDEVVNKDIFKELFLEKLHSILEKNINEKFKKNFAKENKILSEVRNIDKNINFYKNFKDIQQKYPNSISLDILEKYLKLILPYYNLLRNQSLANNILEKQLNEIINKLFVIFSLD